MATTKKKSIFESQGWKVGMKYLYGWGAAIVIVGALFKILHLPGANEMLIVGLGTEAVIFFFSAFEPLPHEDKHYDWEKVYPQLREKEFEDEEEEIVEEMAIGGGGGLIGPKLSKEDLAKIGTLTPDLFESLSQSVKGLQSNVSNMTNITDATVATNAFSEKMKAATVNVDKLSSGYGTAAEAMKAFNVSLDKMKTYQEQIQGETKNYQEQVQKVTKNLSSLNAIYEMELQDAQKHINSINKFYGSISKVMSNLLETSKDTDALRQEVTLLSKNMKSLNTVYGGMLTAMATGASAAKA